MSFIETGGRSPRFLTRAQKWAITNESAPSSSKKSLSTDTRSTRRTPVRTSARMLSAPVAAALGRDVGCEREPADRPRRAWLVGGLVGAGADGAVPLQRCSSHHLVKEVG